MIKGENIYLEHKKNHATYDNICKFLNDSEKTKYMQHGIYNLSMEEIFKQQSDDKKLYLGIHKIGVPEKESHVGNMCLYNIHQTFRTAEISLIVFQHGQGIGTEAIKILTHHAFWRMNLNRLQAGTVSKNIACIKAFEKAGFTKEALLRQVYFCEGEYRDVVIMRILKEEFYNELQRI